ncbi:MAG: DNA gyrase inhibitor YacG [Deltaproteobacteria bacterium]|nr:DNA gyrase inhibitor YacG [Deltaproteobacteria bacterium]
MKSKTSMKVKCPQCGKLVEYEGNRFRPFCSAACKGKDLIAWADEDYSIAGKKAENREDENRD